MGEVGEEEEGGVAVRVAEASRLAELSGLTLATWCCIQVWIHALDAEGDGADDAAAACAAACAADGDDRGDDGGDDEAEDDGDAVSEAPPGVLPFALGSKKTMDPNLKAIMTPAEHRHHHQSAGLLSSSPLLTPFPPEPPTHRDSWRAAAGGLH